MSALIGKTGRVVIGGRISPDQLGEVSIGGQRYHARAEDSGITIEPGSQVLVVSFEPPQTVFVQPI